MRAPSHKATSYQIPELATQLPCFETPPHRVGFHIPGFEHLVSPNGGCYGRVLAVLLREDLGPAVDAEVGDQSCS